MLYKIIKTFGEMLHVLGVLLFYVILFDTNWIFALALVLSVLILSIVSVATEHHRSKINKNTHVYCTHCKHFNIEKVGDDDYSPKCPYADECNLCDCEDSRRFEERPKYEERKP